MAAINLTKFAGLVTAPGLLERNEASCVEAVNWEFPAPGVMRKRRGNERLAGNTGGPVWKLFTSRLMGSALLAHIGSTTEGTQLRYGDGTSNLTSIVTIDADNLTRPRETRMQMAVCQRNHYVTANEGVARLESDFIGGGSDARYAGMPRGLGAWTWSLVGGTNLGAGYARAYRVTFHRKDADGVELGGAPTTRFVIANAAYNVGYTGGARHVSMSVQLPMEFGTLATPLTTDYYWRLWGTRTYLEASELGDDEMHLIAEAYVTVADLANGYFLYTDSTPDSFLLSSPTLHTNLSNFPVGEAGIRQGVVNEDAPPPPCNDVAYWQDVMWFADCSSRPAITVGLLSALADGDTVTVTANGVATTVTAKTVPAVSSDFQIVTAGATTAINLRQTVLHMVRALNQTGGIANGFSAHVVSTTTTQPGLVFIELARPDADPLIFNSSALTKWQGFGGYAIPSNVEIEDRSNLLYFSKPLRADAVPPINVLAVGPADSRILRVHPLRDRLMVFTDYGIYQVTGRTFADFAVYPFDLGYRLMGREFVAQCDEKLYAWCNEGIIEIDDGGVHVISAPIEPTIEAALVATGAGLQGGRDCFAALGYAAAYRNQHQVRFHYPEFDDSGVLNGCAFWLSFDTRTRAWAQGQFSTRDVDGYQDNRSCAVVRFADDLLAFGNWSNAGDTRLFLERRTYAPTDYIDTALNGSPDPVTSSARFQWQVPDASGAQHWQQTALNWDAEEISWRTLPTSIIIAHDTEASASAGLTLSIAEIVTRVETPTDSRRGQRLQVHLTHNTAEYAGVVGVSQTFRQGSRFARGVAP